MKQTCQLTWCGSLTKSYLARLRKKVENHCYKGLSQGRSVAESGPAAIVACPLANTQKKNLRNDVESGCGLLN